MQLRKNKQKTYYKLQINLVFMLIRFVLEKIKLLWSLLKRRSLDSKWLHHQTDVKKLVGLCVFSFSLRENMLTQHLAGSSADWFPMMPCGKTAERRRKALLSQYTQTQPRFFPSRETREGTWNSCGACLCVCHALVHVCVWVWKN